MKIAMKAVEFATADEAIQHAAAEGGAAIDLDGKRLVVTNEDADRLEEAGVEFAYLCVHKGRIMTVPVND